MTMSTYICCEINIKSSSHKEGYEAEFKMCTRHADNDVTMPSEYAMRSMSNPQAAEEAVLVLLCCCVTMPLRYAVR